MGFTLISGIVWPWTGCILNAEICIAERAGTRRQSFDFQYFGVVLRKNLLGEFVRLHLCVAKFVTPTLSLTQLQREAHLVKLPT